MPLDRAIEAIERGHIVDGKTMVGLTRIQMAG